MTAFSNDPKIPKQHQRRCAIGSGPMDFQSLYGKLFRWAKDHGIQTSDSSQLPRNQAGEFDGLSVTMNSDYPLEERCYYLVHSLGSIVDWSIDSAGVQRLFDDLRSAKQDDARQSDAL